MNGRKSRLSRQILESELTKHNFKVSGRSRIKKIKDFLLKAYHKTIFNIKYIINVNIRGLIYKIMIRSVKGIGRKIKADISKPIEMPNYYHSRRMKKRKYKDRYKNE